MRKIKSLLLRIPQLIFLSTGFFFTNSLDACASACAFGFIFSFIPILVMIMTIFVRVLHVSPTMFESFNRIISEISPYINLHKVLDSLPNKFFLTWGNIFLIAFIVWMARKLFLSVIKGLNNIFNAVVPPRLVLTHILTFVGEIFIVAISAITFCSAFILRQITTLPIFSSISESFPAVITSFSNDFANWTFYAILFIFTASAYRFGSGSKPRKTHCAICAFLCTASFIGFIYVISIFLNTSNYNTLYGFLSKIVIFLFEVYIFFILFMYFAQFLFSIQFFNALLIGELYTLPEYEANFISTIRRILFITPFALMTKENTFTVQAGKPIFAEGDKVDCVYYLSFGSVCENRNSVKTIHYKSQFFGEFELLLNLDRIGSAIALTDCQVVKINKEDFAKLIERNPAATSKAMSKLSDYTARFYGRNTTILL